MVKAILRSLAALLLGTALASFSGIAASAEAAAAPMTPLGPGDIFRMSIVGRPEMEGPITVSDDGTAPIPFLTERPVLVAGLSPVEAQKKIAQALKDGDFFLDPQVNITLVQANSQRVTVSGEVTLPGRYPVDARTTVMDLLATAGGAKVTAASVVYILRVNGAGAEQRMPVRIRGQDPSAPTIYLRPGDKLLVPEAEQIYITGEVKNAGRFRWEPDLTVQQAVAMAGGKTEMGSMSRIKITRKDKDGKSKTIKVKPGDPVQPYDTIEVNVSLF